MDLHLIVPNVKLNGFLPPANNGNATPESISHQTMKENSSFDQEVISSAVNLSSAILHVSVNTSRHIKALLITFLLTNSTLPLKAKHLGVKIHLRILLACNISRVSIWPGLESVLKGGKLCNFGISIIIIFLLCLD